MKNLVKLFVLLSLICLTFFGCGEVYHNQSNFIAKSEDGLNQSNDQKNSYGFSIFPTHEQVKNVSKAYSGAAETNFKYQLKRRTYSNQRNTNLRNGKIANKNSGYLPETSSKNVVFSTSPKKNDNQPRLILVQNAEKYAVQILSGPFATDTPLMPNETVEASCEVKPGRHRLHYEWTNLKSGQVGRKTVPRNIVPGQKIIYISEGLARQQGLL